MKDRRAQAAWKNEQRRSRRRLAWIIAFSFVFPLAATAWFLGTERVRGYAFLAVAILLVLWAFHALVAQPTRRRRNGNEPSDGIAQAGFLGAGSHAAWRGNEAGDGGGEGGGGGGGD